MTKKKKKSVLDYDPLAWLNDDSNDSTKGNAEPSQKEVKESKKIAKKSVAKKVAKAKVSKKEATKKKAVKKKSAKKTNVKQQKAVTKSIQKEAKKQEVNESNEVGFGFFSEQDKIPKVEEMQEDEGFGFFSDDPSEADQSAVDDEGFGFFSHEAKTISSSEIDSSEDEGFGFFSDDSTNNNINKATTEITDEGFGFFSNDEELTAVNTETLDITKDEAINLGSELTIKTVAEVKGQIENLLSADEDIIINADEMIKIDTAGLQLLYSLKESLSKTGHHIKWIGTSTVINDSAEIIGMPILAPKSKAACFGFFEENMLPKDAEDGSSGFF